MFLREVKRALKRASKDSRTRSASDDTTGVLRSLARKADFKGFRGELLDNLRRALATKDLEDKASLYLRYEYCGSGLV